VQGCPVKNQKWHLFLVEIIGIGDVGGGQLLPKFMEKYFWPSILKILGILLIIIQIFCGKIVFFWGGANIM